MVVDKAINTRAIHMPAKKNPTVQTMIRAPMMSLAGLINVWTKILRYKRSTLNFVSPKARAVTNWDAHKIFRHLTSVPALALRARGNDHHL